MIGRTLLLAALVLTASPAQAVDAQFAGEANALCRTIIDARDYTTFRDARDKSLDVTIGKLRDDAQPSPQDAAELAGLLQAVNADLAATIDRLQTLPPSPELDAYLAFGQSMVDANAARIGFLANLDDWQWPPADALDTSPYDYNTGMAALGFADRDCAHIFGSLGNPPESAGFTTSVARACTVAYDRLVKTDLDQWREYNLNAMVAALQDKPQDPDAIAALRKLGAAWKETAHAFRLVDSKIEGKPPLWEDALAVMYERARIFEDRADALQYGDQDAIKQAFANRIGTPDFERLGLRETSCMALARLM